MGRSLVRIFALTLLLATMTRAAFADSLLVAGHR